MLHIQNKEDCCGCSACAQICPKKCITMKEDSEGFLYPVTDAKVCVNCKKCETICPIINSESNKSDDAKPDVYVAYHNDEEIRMKSSSGGIFTSLAEGILAEGGAVFGAAFDENYLVVHKSIHSVEELDKLRGSKYLQSKIDQSYVKTKIYLDSGKTVLFTGTACQIAGLKAFLGKDYANLFTLDVLCHGVPSPKLWEKYLEEQVKEHGADIQRIFFRQKNYGWKKFAVSIDFANETAYECIFTKDAFMKLFLSNICLRPSCYKCRFKGMNRPSDITLGDCWGIEKYMPDMDDDKGTSVMLVHTVRGRMLSQIISHDLKMRTAELDKALPPNADSRKSVLPHPRRKQFFVLLGKGKSIRCLVQLLQPSLADKVINRMKKLKRGWG